MPNFGKKLRTKLKIFDHHDLLCWKSICSGLSKIGTSFLSHNADVKYYEVQQKPYKSMNRDKA